MKGRFGWLVLALGLGLGIFACSDSNVVDNPQPDPLPGADAGIDPEDSGTSTEDSGTVDPDAGIDAGSDAGTPADGGVVFNPGAPVPTPTLADWKFFGRGEGGPKNVLGVTSDQDGNIWVAGGADGLFLLTPGATAFRRFTIADGLTPIEHPTGNKQQPVLSVAGGKAGEVFVGYKADDNAEKLTTAQQADPANKWIIKSGDVDAVTLAGTGIAVKHLDIFSPAGTFTENNVPSTQNREKIFSVERITYNPANGDAIFGSPHGVSMWDGPAKRVQEHVHADINGFIKETDTSVTILSDAWKGLAVAPSGDLWIAGAYRTGRVALARTRNIEGGVQPPRPFIDIYPDAVPANPKPSQRVDDNVYDLAMNPDGSFWTASLGRGLALIVPNADATPASLTRIEPTAFFANARFTALERDTTDGSVWVGHQAGGVSRRMASGEIQNYSGAFLASNPRSDALLNVDVPDIQSDTFGGQRRLLVAFYAGAIGIYTGP